MNTKLFSTVVAVGIFIGWIVYLAGVASSNDICTKLGKGDLAITDVVKEIKNPDKFVPIAGPFAGVSLRSVVNIANSASATGRKMLSLDTLLPNHGRALLDKVSDGCGWSYSFYWWTVALQGIATIGILALAFTGHELVHKLRPALFAMLAIVTALLCINASELIPITYNANQIGAKGKYPDAIYATSAGLIITLIFNFTWFISSSLEDTNAVQPVVK